MEQAYFFCAVFGIAVVTLSLLLSLIGIGGDGLDGGDVGAAADAELADSVGDASSGVLHDGGADFLRAFSLRSLAAGIAFFGLGGMAALEFGGSKPLAMGVAVLSGALAIWLVYRLLRTLSALNHNGAITAGTEENAEGVVYLKIPAARLGMGKIEIVQQGRTMEYDALTDDSNELTTGTPIVVVKALTPTQMLVTKRL